MIVCGNSVMLKNGGQNGLPTPSQRFWCGGMTGIAPKFKRLGRVK